MNAAKVLDDLKRRFPNEPEYHQAVEEVLGTIEEEYNKHPEFEKVNLIDRLCIPNLKIYHMKEQAQRADASADHRERCAQKLAVLLEQQKDLSQAIDTLLDDIASGRKFMKVYKQMKMYNDKDTNPVLYKQK